MRCLSLVSDVEEDEEKQKWNPTAKAAKSILKVEKNKSKKEDRTVKFAKGEDIDDNLSEEDISDANDDDFDIAEESEEEMSNSDDEGEEDVTGDKLDMESETKTSRKRAREEVDLKEDIYGRLRDTEGNVVKPGTTGLYVPPAKRALLAGGQNEVLQKRLKGLVNK